MVGQVQLVRVAEAPGHGDLRAVGEVPGPGNPARLDLVANRDVGPRLAIARPPRKKGGPAAAAEPVDVREAESAHGARLSRRRRCASIRSPWSRPPSRSPSATARPFWGYGADPSTALRPAARPGR